MAKPPKDPKQDPRVADLNRYRKEREAQARKKPPKPKPAQGQKGAGQGLVGSNPYAKWILLGLAALLVLFVVVPAVLPLLK